MAHWFKFYGPEYLSDQKFLGMDGNTRSCWLTLLCYASDHGGEVEYLSEEQLMVMSGVPMGGSDWKKTSGILSKFAAKGMIEIEGDLIRIKNWGKRQSLTPYERVKRHREKVRDNEMITTDKNRGEEIRIEESMFDRVWSVYPKKIGKKEAQRAFDKLKADSELTERIVSAIALAKTTSQWKDNEGRYVPHCATYLNQGRFEDELPPPDRKVIGYEETAIGMKPILDPEIEKIRATFKPRMIGHKGDEITIPT